jgi:hypothetical protein
MKTQEENEWKHTCAVAVKVKLSRRLKTFNAVVPQACINHVVHLWGELFSSFHLFFTFSTTLSFQ